MMMPAWCAEQKVLTGGVLGLWDKDDDADNARLCYLPWLYSFYPLLAG